MAHTCSECGDVCYCSGDIDDIVMGYCVEHCSEEAHVCDERCDCGDMDGDSSL